MSIGFGSKGSSGDGRRLSRVSRLSRLARVLAASLALTLAFGSLAPADAEAAAPRSRFTPARKFRRGFSNTFLGILAIPGQMTAQTRKRGAAAGLPLGFGMGLGYFVATELVGVYEFLTCPFPVPPGYKPILEPEFPWAYFEDRAARRAR